MEKIAIEYVGNKPFATDNVAKSGMTWDGKGDVKEVSPDVAAVLLKYPDQWATADGKPLPDAVRDSLEKPTNAVELMSNKQLREYAKTQHGATFKVGMTTEQVRQEVHRLDLQQLDQEKA